MNQQRDLRESYRSIARSMRMTIVGAPVVLAGIALISWQNGLPLSDDFWIVALGLAIAGCAGWIFTAFLLKQANRRP